MDTRVIESSNTTSGKGAISVESSGITVIRPPDDQELWSYVSGSGKNFLRFSALSRICLGGALAFLSLRGNWLLLLLPFAIGIVLGGLINLVWSTQIPHFDRADHLRRLAKGPMRSSVGKRNELPSVDVFICTCGEDPSVVENTIIHAIGLDYEGRVNVFVLDDRDAPEVRAAASLWGATYIVRAERGWMKKAGNLHHAYGISNSDMILVLDADFAVRPDFLHHTLPYFDDEQLGILQTPQFFRVAEDNWVERGAASQQEQFYRVGMRARDKHGGAICVGTNAVYRRSALDERGGMALLEHSEDIFTGMKVIDAGYRVDYLPLPLAAGSTPDSTKALASQQYRWARGNFALAGTPLFKRMKLSPMQRLGLWDGWIFYVTSALSPVIALFVPIVSLAEAPDAITLTPTAMILPALFTEFYLMPRWLHLPDGKSSRRVGLISQVSHLYALRDHLTDRDQEWIPTGGKRSGEKQGTDRIPDQIATAATWGFVVTVMLLAFRVATGWSIIDLAPVGILCAIALPAALGTAKPAIQRRERVEDAPPTESGRDAFLDVVRAISIVRVVFWHALGFWWISWTFAAMPAVFYVSGAVLAKSLTKHAPTIRSTARVVKGRLMRLVPPYYAFIAIVLSLVLIAAPGVWNESRNDVLSWIIPYRAPAPLAWEDGWLSTPLWFLRALIIILVLTPLLRPLGRRIPGAVLFVGWVASLVALDRWVAAQQTDMDVAIVRGVADVICFGGFFVLGASGHTLRYKLSRRTRFGLAVLLFATAAVIAVVEPPTDNVVNNSYVLFGLVGLAWLFVMLGLEDHLRHLGEVAAIRTFVSWITNSAMSIYLWHTLALILAYHLVGAPGSLGAYAMLGAVFLIFLPIIVAAVRPLESVGTRRSRGGAPVRALPILGLAVATALLATQATLFPVFTDAVGPPTPSGRPPVDGQPASAAAPTDADEVPPPVAEPTEAERAAMRVDGEAWLAGLGVDAAAVVEIGAPTDGEAETIRLGDDEALDPDAPFEALSLTKTMVAAVALQMVDEGALTLDGPLPEVEGIDPAVTEELTLRRLLSHSSGISDYRENPDFRDDMVLSPIEAVNLAVGSSDLSSTVSSYAAPNYLLSGLVVETVANAPLDEVLEQRLFEPLGMDDTRVINNQREGFVGHGSAGVVSTLADLAHWYDALMRQRLVLPDELRDELLFGGIVYQPNAGLGTWRHCPCDPGTALDPEPFLYAFHDGGDARLVYIPSRDVVLAMRFSTSLYGPERIVDDVVDFTFAVADRRN